MNTPRGALSPLALAVLELLHEGPRHPYEIQQQLRDREAERLTKMTVGSLYHAVEKLNRTGLIEVVETSREGRRPERTTYRLTDAGRDAFAERLRDMVGKPATEYPEFAMAVAYLHTLDREDALRQLRRRSIALESTLAAKPVIIDRLTKQRLHPLYWVNIRYSAALVEAELRFVNDLIAQLTSGEISWPGADEPGGEGGLTVLPGGADQRGTNAGTDTDTDTGTDTDADNASAQGRRRGGRGGARSTGEAAG
ncbi:helix-turn-helix transcriptional regulator [Goodfellowiella coeruleoviolacea]|uniref:helix-turn-helix transcriptional regulator n=1 Tax=Goodfellowiella coeruleoviolacea TaxID=334858 RepID=UPI0020A2A68E|nr:PadR family transcriptional regulator [Goodfellowiella coeruleoviolacea]